METLLKEQAKELTAEDVWALFRETTQRFQETDRKFQETDRKFQETNAKIDALVGKWGRFVEGLVAPAAIRLFAERGIRVNRIFQRVKARLDGRNMEVDILAVDDEYAVLIEVKSTLGVEDIQEHVERLGMFREFFPEYRDRKVVGAVAGIVIAEGADRLAYKQGLFVIAQSGEAVAILNDAEFQPRVW